MTNSDRTFITVETLVKVQPEKAWECWTSPEHIVHWNFASDDWHSPAAGNDLRPGGKFSYRMESRDGSVGFDFEGIYDEVKPLEKIAYTLLDDRKVEVLFRRDKNGVVITETFEAEKINTPELQKTGWQAILDNFRKYVEE